MMVRAVGSRTQKMKRTVHVKVMRAGVGQVLNTVQPKGTTVRVLLDYVLVGTFGEFQFGDTIFIGGKKVTDLGRVLKDGDIVTLSGRILCACNKVVRWKSETSAMFTNVESMLREYLGGAVHSIEYDHGLNRWLCVLLGKSVRFSDKPRSFEVFWEVVGIRTSPHSQDDFTKAVADGFAALCEKKWNREPPEDREAD